MARRNVEVKRRSCLVSGNAVRRHKRHVSFPVDLLLESAVRDGDVEETDIILSNYDHEEVDIDSLHCSGVCALHQSVLHRNVDLTEMLLRHGACVDRRDVVGWTPLHASAAMSAADCARLLISAGADVYARTHGGELPLDLVDAEESEGVLCVKYIAQAMQRKHSKEQLQVQFEQRSMARTSEPGSRASTADSGIDIEWDSLSLTGALGEVCIDFAAPKSPLSSPAAAEAQFIDNILPAKHAQQRHDVADSDSESESLEQLMLSGMVAKLFRRSSSQSSKNRASVSGEGRERVTIADLRSKSITYV